MFLFSSISQMVVDRVCVVRSQNASECVNQDVLFLGTSELTIAMVPLVFTGRPRTPRTAGWS